MSLQTHSPLSTGVISTRRVFLHPGGSRRRVFLPVSIRLNAGSWIRKGNETRFLRFRQGMRALLTPAGPHTPGGVSFDGSMPAFWGSNASSGGQRAAALLIE